MVFLTAWCGGSASAVAAWLVCMRKFLVQLLMVSGLCSALVSCLGNAVLRHEILMSLLILNTCSFLLGPILP